MCTKEVKTEMKIFPPKKKKMVQRVIMGHEEIFENCVIFIMVVASKMNTCQDIKLYILCVYSLLYANETDKM